MDVLVFISVVGFLALATSLVARSLPNRGPVAPYVGLFANPCDLGWPTGVQEEYDPAWGRASRGSASARSTPESEAEPDQPVIEDLAGDVPGPVLTRLG